MAGALASATALGGLLAPPASAHARLLETTPAANSAASSAPRTISARFNETVRGTPGRCLLLTASRGPVPLEQMQCSGSTLSATVRAPLTPGRYVATYRATSADGHLVEAAVAFAVRTSTPVARPMTAVWSGQPVRLSGAVVGVRTLRLPWGRAIGTVSWRHARFSGALTWQVRDGVASGMLPFPGRYRVRVAVWESAWTEHVLTGVVQVR